MTRARELVAQNPRWFVGTMVGLTLVFWFAMGASALFAHQMLSGVPERHSLGSITEMARSSVFYDQRGSSGLHHLQGTADRDSAGRDVAAPAPGDDRDRGPALLRSPGGRSHPRRRRRAGQPARGPSGAGGEHHHAAARAPQFPDAREDLLAQAAGSRAGRAHRERLLQGSDSRALSQQGLFRRRPVWRGSGGPRILRQARVGPDAGRRRDARRAGQGALQLRAHGEPRARGRPSRHGAPGDARLAGHRPCRLRRGACQQGRTHRLAAARGAVRTVLQGARAPRADRAVRRGARLRGRPQGLHHHRPRHAARGGRGSPARAQGPRPPAQHAQGRRPGRPAGGAGRPRPADRRGARAHRRPRLRAEQLQPRHPGPAPAGIGLQAVRLRRGARSGLQPRQPDHRPRRADCHRPGRVDSRGRALRRRAR